MIRRVAVTLTVLGLIADWAYMHFYVATLFMGMGEWGFGLWWTSSAMCGPPCSIWSGLTAVIPKGTGLIRQKGCE